MGYAEKLYSEDQLRAIFKRIELPEKHQKFSVASLSDVEKLEYLETLQKFYMSAIPFENLSLHYNPTPGISLHPEAIFRKLILSPGRGGYCMENNALYGTLLKTLGYTLYYAPGRIHVGGICAGMQHMVHVVTVGGKKYMVDAGFGPSGPVRPFEMVKENAPVLSNLAPCVARLSYRALPEHTDPDQRSWVFENKIHDGAEWAPQFSFTETECFPQDFAVMNVYTSSARDVWFPFQVCAAKMLLGGESGEELIGVVILMNNIKWRVNGKTEKEIPFSSEADRLKALEEHFGITFSQEEKDGIFGLPSMIRGQAQLA